MPDQQPILKNQSLFNQSNQKDIDTSIMADVHVTGSL